jgi:lipid-A-disaccharide synthase-like uncharacterized protein
MITIFDLLPFNLSTETWWIILGFVGQGLFMMRFLVQWIASQKAQKSVIPATFWYYSVLGTLILFMYAIYRQDPVFILVQAMAFFMYARNMVFVVNAGKSPHKDD